MKRDQSAPPFKGIEPLRHPPLYGAPVPQSIRDQRRAQWRQGTAYEPLQREHETPRRDALDDLIDALIWVVVLAALIVIVIPGVAHLIRSAL